MISNILNPDIESTSDFDEYAELFDKLNNADYVHFNIPIGNDAISKYENTIADVDKVDVSKFNLSDFESEMKFNNILVTLINTMKYYKGIADVYSKTDFVISDTIDLKSANADNDAVYGVYISSKEKELLNKAIKKISAKIHEMDKLRIMQKKILVVV